MKPWTENFNERSEKFVLLQFSTFPKRNTLFNGDSICMKNCSCKKKCETKVLGSVRRNGQNTLMCIKGNRKAWSRLTLVKRKMVSLGSLSQNDEVNSVPLFLCTVISIYKPKIVPIVINFCRLEKCIEATHKSFKNH